jgi:predicted TIM-barrel fold metal-dependent hydrolase
MKIELREPRLVWQIEQLAAKTTQPAEQVVETAVRAYLDKLEREAIHHETEVFWARQAELVHAYPGQFVAIYQGELIDHDQDVKQLEQRVRERWGAASVLIAPVSSEARRDLFWRGGQADRLGLTP